MRARVSEWNGEESEAGCAGQGEGTAATVVAGHGAARAWAVLEHGVRVAEPTGQDGDGRVLSGGVVGALGASARGSSGLAGHVAGELCLAVHSETQKRRGGREGERVRQVQTWVSAFDFSFLQ